jgi:hypothetical protein
MGFEDQRRDTGSDQDFNDVVMLIRSNPIEAIQSTTNVPIATRTPILTATASRAWPF